VKVGEEEFKKRNVCSGRAGTNVEGTDEQGQSRPGTSTGKSLQQEEGGKRVNLSVLLRSNRSLRVMRTQSQEETQRYYGERKWTCQAKREGRGVQVKNKFVRKPAMPSSWENSGRKKGESLGQRKGRVGGPQVWSPGGGTGLHFRKGVKMRRCERRRSKLFLNWNQGKEGSGPRKGSKNGDRKFLLKKEANQQGPVCGRGEAEPMDLTIIGGNARINGKETRIWSGRDECLGFSSGGLIMEEQKHY